MTHWPIEIRGPTHIQSNTGAIRLQPDVLSGVRLQAETVTVEFEWERGYEGGGEEPTWRVVTEDDRETRMFQQADIRFDRFTGQGLFLAYTQEATAELALGSQTGLTFSGVEDPAIVNIGPRPESVRAGETGSPGFWHRLTGPTLHAAGTSSAHVTGSFTLFVHDVEVHVDAADGKWSRWTGYQQSEAGPVSEFEYRLTRIHVNNGTFVSSSEERVDQFASTINTDIQGTATVPGAVGRLIQGQKILVFDEDLMVLEGTGTIELEATETSGPGSVAIWLHPSGDLTAHGASTVEAARSSGQGPPLSLVLKGLAGFAFVTLTTAGLARVGVVPIPMEFSRRRRYEKWMSRGMRSYADGSMNHASNCFRKATRTKREEPLAWFHWAHTTLEAGHPETADEIAQRAAAVPGIDTLDLLDLRASAAWQRGDQEALGRFLSELAQSSPEMAWRFLLDFEIPESQVSPDLRKSLKTGGSEAILDGYA